MKSDLSLFNLNAVTDSMYYDKNVIECNIKDWSVRTGIKVLAEDYLILKNEYDGLLDPYIFIFTNIYKRVNKSDYLYKIKKWILEKGTDSQWIFLEILFYHFYLIDRVIYNIDNLNYFSSKDNNIVNILMGAGISFNEIIFANLSIDSRISPEYYTSFFVVDSTSYSYKNNPDPSYVYSAYLTDIPKDVMIYISYHLDWLKSYEFRKYGDLSITNAELLHYFTNEHLTYNCGLLDVSVNPDNIILMNQDILINCIDDVNRFKNSVFQKVQCSTDDICNLINGDYVNTLFLNVNNLFVKTKKLRLDLMAGNVLIFKHNNVLVFFEKDEHGYVSHLKTLNKNGSKIVNSDIKNYYINYLVGKLNVN